MFVGCSEINVTGKHVQHVVQHVDCHINILEACILLIL